VTLALDGFIGANFSGTNSGGMTLTTSNNDDIIIVAIGHEDHGHTIGQTVSSVTATGLTFAKRASAFNHGDVDGSACEVWWAYAAAAGSYPITVTLTGAIDDACIIAFGVTGADTAAPFDEAAVLPQINTGRNASPWFTGHNQSGPLSTRNADTFLFTIGGGQTNPQSAFASPWTQIISQGNGGGALFSGCRAYYQIVSAEQHELPIQSSDATTNFWCQITDAIVAASPSPNLASIATDGLTTCAVPFGNTSTNNLYLTTHDSNDLIIAAVCYNGRAPGTFNASVASIASSNTTGWAKQKDFTFKGATGTAADSAIEIWTATASAPLTDEQITVTFANAPNGASVEIWGVSGADLTTPFDVNVNSSVTNDNNNGSASAPSWSGLSTTNADCILYTVVSNTNSSTPFTPPAGFGQIAQQEANIGTNWAAQQMDDKFVTSAQSAVSGTYTGTTTGWGVITFAIQQAATTWSVEFTDEDGLDATLSLNPPVRPVIHLTDQTEVEANLSVLMPFNPPIDYVDESFLTAMLKVLNPVYPSASMVDESVLQADMSIKVRVVAQTFVIITGR
jgi:hypothetical protein